MFVCGEVKFFSHKLYLSLAAVVAYRQVSSVNVLLVFLQQGEKNQQETKKNRRGYHMLCSEVTQKKGGGWTLHLKMNLKSGDFWFKCTAYENRE